MMKKSVTVTNSIYYYQGLTTHVESTDIPEACKLQELPTGEQILSIPTVWCRDNQILCYQIRLYENNIRSAYLGDIELCLENFGVSINEIWNIGRIGILVDIMMKLGRCLGCEATFLFEQSEKSTVTKENWRLMYETESHNEFHSVHCIGLVHFTARGQVCRMCTESQKYNNKKRKQPLPDISDDKQQNFESKEKETTNNDEITLNENDHQDLSEILKKILPDCQNSKFKTLLESQVNNIRAGADPRGRRWSTELIRICLSMWVRSPQSYEDLKQSGFLVLPSGRLLSYYKNSVKQDTGFISENLEWMQQEADRQGITAGGRRGGLLIDEMQIQSDLQVKKSWFMHEMHGYEF